MLTPTNSVLTVLTCLIMKKMNDSSEDNLFGFVEYSLLFVCVSI